MKSIFSQYNEYENTQKCLFNNNYHQYVSWASHNRHSFTLIFLTNTTLHEEFQGQIEIPQWNEHVILYEKIKFHTKLHLRKEAIILYENFKNPYKITCSFFYSIFYEALFYIALLELPYKLLLPKISISFYMKIINFHAKLLFPNEALFLYGISEFPCKLLIHIEL